MTFCRCYETNKVLVGTALYAAAYALSEFNGFFRHSRNKSCKNMCCFHILVDSTNQLYRCYETNKVLVGTALYAAAYALSEKRAPASLLYSRASAFYPRR